MLEKNIKVLRNYMEDLITYRDYDIEDTFDDKVSALKKYIDCSLRGIKRKKADKILSEIVMHIRRCEIPGVNDRWREINPKITFFDCEYSFIKENINFFDDYDNSGFVHFNHIPDAEMIKQQREYMLEKKKEFGDDFYEMFNAELINTLRLVLEHDFKNEKDDYKPSDLQKKEGYLRMKKLTKYFELNPDILKYLKEDKIYYSHQMFGKYSAENILYSDDYLYFVQEFQNINNFYVYHVIETEDFNGNLYLIFLYVSPEERKESWPSERPDGRYVMGCITGIDSEIKEFGTFKIDSSDGALIRIG